MGEACVRFWVNQNDANALPEPEREFEAGDNKEYEVEAIIDSAVVKRST